MQHVVRDEPGEEQPARDLPRELRGLQDDVARGHDHVRRVRGHDGVAEDVLALLEARDALADRRDAAGEVAALPVGEGGRHLVGEAALADVRLDVVDARREDLDEHLAGAGRGTRDVDDLEDVDAAEGSELHLLAGGSR